MVYRSTLHWVRHRISACHSVALPELHWNVHQIKASQSSFVFLILKKMKIFLYIYKLLFLNHPVTPFRWARLMLLQGGGGGEGEMRPINLRRGIVKGFHSPCRLPPTYPVSPFLLSCVLLCDWLCCLWCVWWRNVQIGWKAIWWCEKICVKYFVNFKVAFSLKITLVCDVDWCVRACICVCVCVHMCVCVCVCGKSCDINTVPKLHVLIASFQTNQHHHKEDQSTQEVQKNTVLIGKYKTCTFSM